MQNHCVDTSTLTARIQELCEKKGLTFQQLEERAGLSKGALSKLKKGQAPRLPTLKKIADGLNTTIAALQGEQDDQGESPTGPRLDRIPGYSSAEFEVARRMKNVDYAIFLEAREARLTKPPPVITVKFLTRFIEALLEAKEETPPVPSLRKNRKSA